MLNPSEACAYYSNGICVRPLNGTYKNLFERLEEKSAPSEAEIREAIKYCKHWGKVYETQERLDVAIWALGKALKE